jgi:hypothetical protein
LDLYRTEQQNWRPFELKWQPIPARAHGPSKAEVLSAHGHEAAFVEFDAKRKDMFEKYRAQRLDFYQSVRRFSGYAFWQNRILH